jgi:hypothetical protein
MSGNFSSREFSVWGQFTCQFSSAWTINEICHQLKLNLFWDACFWCYIRKLRVMRVSVFPFNFVMSLKWR